MTEEKSITEYSFEDLDINDDFIERLYIVYGFEKPSNIQYKSLPIFNSGKDMIAQSQSGTGKTGAFSIGVLNNIDLTLKKTQYIYTNPNT